MYFSEWMLQPPLVSGSVLELSFSVISHILSFPSYQVSELTVTDDEASRAWMDGSDEGSWGHGPFSRKRGRGAQGLYGCFQK